MDRAIEELCKIIADPNARPEDRQHALEALKALCGEKGVFVYPRQIYPWQPYYPDYMPWKITYGNSTGDPLPELAKVFCQ